MRQRIIKNIRITIILLLEILVWFGNANSKHIETNLINGYNDGDGHDDGHGDGDDEDHKVEAQQSEIEHNIQRQFSFHRHKETTADNFIRLLVMRLIYGLAVTMGMEDRLEGLFNGAFVPPNADSDYYFALSGFSDYADDARSKDVLDIDV